MVKKKVEIEGTWIDKISGKVLKTSKTIQQQLKKNTRSIITETEKWTKAGMVNTRMIKTISEPTKRAADMSALLAKRNRALENLSIRTGLSMGLLRKKFKGVTTGSVEFGRKIKDITVTSNKFKKEQEKLNAIADKQRGLDKFARGFNRLGGVMGMGMQQFKKFDDGTGRLNKRMMKQLGVMGRLGMRVRFLTHGFRGFRMELLGVMFFGMGIQRFFTGLIKPALTVTGVFKLWSTILTILFLPIALKLLDWTIKFMDWMNKSERLQKFIRWITVIGVVLGSLLFFIGMFGLGIGSLLVAFSVIISPIIAAVGALFAFLASIATSKIGILALIAAFVGLAPTVSAAGDEVKKQGGIWSMLTGWISGAVSKIIGKLDELWDKFLESGPVMKLMETMGLSAETIAAISNPIATVKKKLTELWVHIGGIFGIKAQQSLAHPFEWLGKFLPTWLKIQKNKLLEWFAELVPENVKTSWTEFTDSFQDFVDAIAELNIGNLNTLLTVMAGIAKILAASIEGWKWWIAGIRGEGGMADVGASVRGGASPEAVIPLDQLPDPTSLFNTFEPIIRVIVENNTDAIIRVAPDSL